MIVPPLVPRSVDTVSTQRGVQPLNVDALPVVAGCVIPISRLTCSSMVVSVKLPCSSSREMPAGAQETDRSVGADQPASSHQEIPYRDLIWQYVRTICTDLSKRCLAHARPRHHRAAKAIHARLYRASIREAHVHTHTHMKHGSRETKRHKSLRLAGRPCELLVEWLECLSACTHLDNRCAITRASKLWRHFAYVAGITAPLRVLSWITTRCANLLHDISPPLIGPRCQLLLVNRVRPNDHCEEDDQEYNEHYERRYRRPAAASAEAGILLGIARRDAARAVSCLVQLGRFRAYFDSHRP
jgi:hypothetical protein